MGRPDEGLRADQDKLDHEEAKNKSLDAAQLVKHALALRTQVNRDGRHRGLTPILFYVYAEPEVWPGDGKPVGEAAKTGHRSQIATFAEDVSGDEVRFVHCAYRRLLDGWLKRGAPHVRTHAEAVLRCFAP